MTNACKTNNRQQECTSQNFESALETTLSKKVLLCVVRTYCYIDHRMRTTEDCISIGYPGRWSSVAYVIGELNDGHTNVRVL